MYGKMAEFRTGSGLEKSHDTNITTSALTRVAGARPGMAGSETSHIYNSLVLPA